MIYKIKIPKPCNEEWSEMTPTEKGAYCLNCKKEVIDYTSMSNYQLAKLLDSNKKLCGKFKPEQLDINISSLENNKHSKMGLLLGASALLSLSTPMLGQNKTAEIVKVEQDSEVKKELSITKKLNDSIQIKGQVLDENGGLPGVNIVVKGNSCYSQTDFDGDFLINTNEEEINKNLILVFSFVGYETQEIEINQKTEFIKVKMEDDNALIGEIVIIKKKNIFRRIGSLFRKKDTETCH